jgi:MurNAc alpha-1-phosphate uridylyltransferase
MEIKTAMVLAAGLGTRMRPLTDDRPKALVEVAGRTLIDHVLDRLIAAGVTRAVVNVHAHADRLEAHLKTRSDIEIIISDERDDLLETGGGVVKALPHLGLDPFFCANIDSIWIEHTPALAQLTAGFRPDRMDAFLLLADKTQSLGYDGAGDFDRAPDGQIAFRTHAAAPYVYTGFQILDPSLFQDAPVAKGSLRPFWQQAVARQRIYGTVLDGFWMHVGDPEARAAAETRWLDAVC